MIVLFQAAALRIETDAEGAATLWLDVPDRSVNVFNRGLLDDLDAALDRVAAAPGVRLLVVRSAKPSGFIAGADLHDFAAIQSAADATALSQRGQRLFDRVAELRVPVVAVIHGPCLGGGLEFALACDYRLALDHPSTQLGFPEIERGLIPGWGGTQRLPRVVGLKRGLEMILATRRLGALEALRWRLVDAVAPGQQFLPMLLGRLSQRALTEGKRPKKDLPLYTWGQRLLEYNALGRRVIFGGFERVLRRRVADDIPAPGEALEAVRVGLAGGMVAGLAQEREGIGRLATSPACRNLVHLWSLTEKARRLPEEVRRSGTKVRKVGIVGAGTMGAGIAQLALLRGCDVVIQEVNADALGAGMLKLAALLDKAAQRGLIARSEADRKLAGVKATTNWDGFGDVDVVVEAVIEDAEAKRTVFRELEKHTPADAVLATNTSSLAVQALQEGLAQPRRVAGLHFFNPVHKMPLVEVARTAATHERTVATLVQWAIALGKVPVVVRDSPGFVVNRVLMPYLNEAVLLVAEGMPVAQVDSVMTRFGMPMGPLELLDQVGLDVAGHIARAIAPAFGARFPPSPVFEALTQHGWLGQKNSWGFYRYRGRKPHVNKAAELALREGQQTPGAALWAALPPAVRLQQARDRMVLLMVNQAAAVLGEGLVESADLIDMAMVLGTGWAPHRGGPLRYAADRGLPAVVQALAEFAQRLGPRFEPCPELRRLAERGGSGG
jgi:3-hydroxyacyl-CoA dehydrogenase / enoyl-CoA hydratase / 3-hydroxybutyryl-CoA epimerase